MVITLLLALICTNAQAQSPAQNTTTPTAQKPPVPLYYQITQNAVSVPPTKNQAEALSKARDMLTNMNAAIQGTAGTSAPTTQAALPTTPSRTPSSVNTALQPPTQPSFNAANLPANSPLNRPASADEEQAAKFLQEQAKKMQQALKDMELSN